MDGIKGKDRLIVALDMPEVDKAKEMVTQLDGIVSFFKVGIILHIGDGLQIVDWIIKEQKKKVFLDLKYYDIENTVREAVKSIATKRVSFLTVHGNGDIMRGAVEGKKGSDLKIFAVTVLTSLDDKDIEEMTGIKSTVENLVLHRAKNALEHGCDGVIASGKEVREIKERYKDKLLIVTPGIRLKGEPKDDQKRIATATEAIEAGADYLVIGRPIIKAPNPRKAAESFIKEMDIAFQKRNNK